MELAVNSGRCCHCTRCWFRSAIGIARSVRPQITFHAALGHMSPAGTQMRNYPSFSKTKELFFRTSLLLLTRWELASGTIKETFTTTLLSATLFLFTSGICDLCILHVCLSTCIFFDIFIYRGLHNKNIFIQIYIYLIVLLCTVYSKMLWQSSFFTFVSVAMSYGRLPLAKLYFRLCHFCFWNKGKSFHCSVVAGTICQQTRLPFSIRHHLLQILREFTHDILW